MSAENLNPSSSNSEMEQMETSQSQAGSIEDRESVPKIKIVPPVKLRVRALKKLLSGQLIVDTKFYTDMHNLECKYHELYMDLYNKRSDIVQGNYEPTEEECDFPSDVEDDGVNDITSTLEGIVKLDNSKPATQTVKNKNDRVKYIPDFTSATENDDVKNVSASLQGKRKLDDYIPATTSTVNSNSGQIKGIPDFWLTILKNSSLISEMIKPQDEPILKHLIDIKLDLFKEPMGYVLKFHFSPNQWFTNDVLTKEYEMKCVPNPKNPFIFDGIEVIKSKGSTIQWNKGKDVTIKLIKEKRTNKIRCVDKESFFHFFSPSGDPENVLDKTNIDSLRIDYEIGRYIREQILPRSVLYFTGEASDESDFDDDDDDSEFDNDEDEYYSNDDMSFESESSSSLDSCIQ